MLSVQRVKALPFSHCLCLTVCPNSPPASDRLNIVPSTELSTARIFRPSVVHFLVITPRGVTCAPLTAHCVAYTSIVAPSVACVSTTTHSLTCALSPASLLPCARTTSHFLTRILTIPSQTRALTTEPSTLDTLCPLACFAHPLLQRLPRLKLDPRPLLCPNQGL